jgi:pimeloyl-ACP methyl ester carboxylesterase
MLPLKPILLTMVKIYPHPKATITYQQVGEGIPVVLLHGFGEDSGIWERQVDVLQSVCRLYVPDLPGSGLSTVNADALDAIVSLDAMADTFIDFLQNVVGEPAIVLGHSMGGYLALAIAEKQPALLCGLGLVHSTAFADGEEKKETRRKAIDFITRYGSRAFLETAIPGLFGTAFSQTNQTEIDTLVNRSEQFAPETLVSYYRAMLSRPNRTQVLKGSAWPVLFVIGSEDKAAPMTDVLQQTHLPETSVVHVLENTGHMGMLEQPDQLNKILADFVRLCTNAR